MNGVLVVLGTRTGAPSCNVDTILLADLLLYCELVSFLRRIQTWVKVEEHSIARARRSIRRSDYCSVVRLEGWMMGCEDLMWTLLLLLLLLVVMWCGSYSGLRRESILWRVCNLAVSCWTVVCFESILVILMLLLP